jgi:integrase
MAIHRRLEGPDDTPQTIDELIDEYELFKGSSLKRAEGTMRSIRDILNPFRPRHPAGLTPRELAAVLRTKSLTAPSHANRQLAYVKAMFNWARKQGMVDRNPAEHLPKLAKELPRERTPTLEEVVKIWEALESRPAPYSQIVRLLILTGCRLLEVGHMRARELEFRDGQIGDVWTIPAERSKNGQAIRIPLSPQAREVISEVYCTGADYVFAANGPGPFNGWQRAKAALDRTMLMCGDEIPHWRHHDLRRSLATFACDELECSKEVVDRCLNHIGSATSSTVSRVYIRSELFSQRKKVLEGWADAVLTAVQAARPKSDPAAQSALWESLFLPPTDLSAYLAANEAETERRLKEREEWMNPPNLEAMHGPRANPTLERAGEPPLKRLSIQPKWMKQGGWIERAGAGGPAPLERGACYLEKIRKQSWWRAIAQWAEGLGLPCYRQGEILYLTLSNAQAKEFLLRMGRLGVEHAETEADYLIFKDYYVCAWFDGQPDEAHGFDETDRYFRYALRTDPSNDPG